MRAIKLEPASQALSCLTHPMDRDSQLLYQVLLKLKPVMVSVHLESPRGRFATPPQSSGLHVTTSQVDGIFVGAPPKVQG